MLGIHETFKLIDKLKKNNIRIDGLNISNSVDKSFGRTYVRTHLDFITDTILWPDDKYISYQVDRNPVDKERQDECDHIFQEQIKDINALSEKILSLYPDANIIVLLSPYFCYAHSECMITGEIAFSKVKKPINIKLKDSYLHSLDYFDYWKKQYQHISKWVKSNYKL